MAGGRSPCCDKTKVKKGPWSPAEDIRLVSFIQKHGHTNWRSLPKQAGLLRCGKSCRLRWINYLRPDVKRGNFTPEEEQFIIRLHATFGNKWSKIASHLPGRTDNEIKNVWNTHLKKRSLQFMNNKNQTPSSSLASNEHTNEEKPSNPKATLLTKPIAATISVEDIDQQPSTPTSTISCSNSSGQDKASCNYDEDESFWNMLEPQLVTDHDMLEVENWVRLLEKELELTDQDNQTKTMGEEEQAVWCKISDQLLSPTSPTNFGMW